MKVKAREKQIISLSKAFTIAVITVSANYHNKKIKAIDIESEIFKRCKEIQRKYGYHFCMLILPEIIQSLEERKYVKLSLKENSEKEKVKLLYKPLINFFKSLGGEYTETEEKESQQGNYE